MTTPPKTPPTKASPRPTPPRAPTTPPPPTAPAGDALSLSPPGRGNEAAQRRGERGSDLAERRVILAVVIGAHGITGEVRLKLFTDDLTPYKRFNGGALTIKSLRTGNYGAIARFAEIPDRTAAERLRGTELTVPRSELPPLKEGEFYHTDLIGLPCDTEAGEPVGHVVAVENFGAGDILEIEKPDGKRFMVSVKAATVADTVTIDVSHVD